MTETSEQPTNAIESNTLLECPLCGQKADTARIENGRLIIGCVGEIECLLNLGVVGIEFDNIKDASEMWNMRASNAHSRAAEGETPSQTTQSGPPAEVQRAE